MTEMSERYFRKIIHFAGKQGTDETTIIFNDKSQLLFRFISSPEFQIIGSENSVAAKFRHHVIGALVLETKFEFTFWDKSKFSFDMKDAFRAT